MGQTPWARPERHVSIGSTNTEALADPRPGRVVVADHQSAGMGRRGRGWDAPPGAALAITVVVPAPPPAARAWLPLLAGVAVAQALRDSWYAVPVALKWPNDVLAREGPQWRKVCGVLAQVAHHPVHGAVVVVGAGVNIDQSRAELPVDSATSWRLARGGGPLPAHAREDLLEAYLQRLGAVLEDPAAGRAAYRRLCRTTGAEVRVHLPDGKIREGVATHVDDSGALVVRGEGAHTVHHAGDVVHLRSGG